MYHFLNKIGIRATYYESKRKKWSNLHCAIIRGYEMLNKWNQLIGTNNPKHMKKFYSLIRYGPAEI